VYRDFDIGTGKPTGTVKRVEGRRAFMVDDVPHYLMDFLTPDVAFTVAEWREKAMTAVKGITERQHLPIVVGGTGLYIQALVDNYRIPSVPPQPAYREAMEEKTLEELARILLKMDPGAEKVVDLKNKRRVLRALEVTTFSGKPFSQLRSKARPVVNTLLISIARDKAELHERIHTAIERMIEQGWIDEIRRLHAQGIPWDAPAMSSIGYKELAAYVRGECTLEEAIERVKRATRQYAKRQMTWFKRDPRIYWVRTVDEADVLVRKWLKKRNV
jgi:tRNA dimethylallyltransferase